MNDDIIYALIPAILLLALMLHFVKIGTSF